MNVPTGFAAEERVLLRGVEVDYRHLQSMYGWFPVLISEESATLWWRHMGSTRFLESFFQDSLSRQDVNDRRVCRTPLAVLHQLTGEVEGITPTAFIFHVSRCGSTLLTQMLASLESSVVASEPPVLDAFFRYYQSHPGLSDPAQLFRDLLHMLGQKRSGDEKHFFIKLDSWHLPWVNFVHEVFPDTPVIFLYRQPEEVLRSHQRQRGPQMIPGLLDTSRLQPDFSTVAVADLDAYTAAMLTAMFAEGVKCLASDKLFLLNYSQLPSVLWQELLSVFGMQCTEVQLKTMQERSRLHSKHRHLEFQGDPVSDTKATQTHCLSNLLMQVNQMYELLEKNRTG
ncbi:sulfotransferase [Undibacterium sp. SXout7W]|uniref:sulfotransferase n=1 Tax=Undibacterium sp. SXout7W TaxID=3413049 RepID=UPI003BF0FA88